MKRIIITFLTIALTATTVLFVFGSTAYATNEHGYGYGGDRVDVCKEVGSKFKPYIKVTVPEFIAQRWIDAGEAIWPDGNNECPEGINIRDYIQDLLDDIFSRFR